MMSTKLGLPLIRHPTQCKLGNQHHPHFSFIIILCTVYCVHIHPTLIALLFFCFSCFIPTFSCKTFLSSNDSEITIQTQKSTSISLFSGWNFHPASFPERDINYVKSENQTDFPPPSPLNPLCRRIYSRFCKSFRLRIGHWEISSCPGYFQTEVQFLLFSQFRPF